MVNIPEDELKDLDQDAKDILAEMEQGDEEEAPFQKEEQPQEKSAEEPQEEAEETSTEKKEEDPPEIKTEVSRNVPLAKYQTKKRKWQEEKEELSNKIEELEKRLNTTHQQNPDVTNDSALEEIANKWNLDKDLVKDLGKAFSNKSLPDDVLKEIEELRNEKREREQREKIEEAYAQELESLSTSLKDVDMELVDLNKLKQLAFSDRYAKTDLETIFKANRDDLIKPVAKKTFESSSNNEQPEAKDISKMTDADIPKMTDEEFDQYMEIKGKRGGLLSKS